MKINIHLKEDLLNPRFCTLDEAMAYAKSLNNADVWLTVIQRVDMPIAKAFEIASTFGQISIWKEVVSNLKLPLIDAEETVARVGSELWPSVLRRSDVDFVHAYSIAKNLSCMSLAWKIVLLEKGVGPHRAVHYALEINRNDVWNFLLQDEHVTEYFKEMNYGSIVEIAEKADYSVLWKLSMEKSDAGAEQVIYCAKRSTLNDSWTWAIQQKKVIYYLESLRIEDLILLAKAMGSPRLWEKVLVLRPEMNARLAFLYLREAEDDEVWKRVLARKSILLYIKKLKPETAISLAKSINHWRIWRIISNKDNLKAYLQKLECVPALNLALNLNCPEIKSFVLKRLDISIEDIVEFIAEDAPEFTNPLMGDDEWKIVVSREDFKAHLASLDDVRAIALAAISGNTDVWTTVLGRTSISPADAIACAKRSNIANVWDIVRLRKDVVQYLSQ